MRRIRVVSDGTVREWIAERCYYSPMTSCDPSYTPRPSGRGWVLWRRGGTRVHCYVGSLARVLRFLAHSERGRGAGDVRVYDGRGALVIR